MKLISNKTFAAVIAAGAFMLAGSAAHAGVIGVFGGAPSTSDVRAGLTPHGHTVVDLQTLSAASLAGLDAVVLGRYATGNSDLASYITGGGKLITEWTSAAYAMSLLGGVASDNYGNPAASTVVFSAAGLAAGLGNGLGASYSDGGATEFFQDFTNLGRGTVYATRNGGAAAIVGGAVGDGFVWANGYDWGDGPGAGLFQLLDNELAVSAASVPEPGSFTLLGLGLLGLIGLRRRA